MNLAGTILTTLAPNARSNYVEAFQNGEPALNRHEITTPLRLAHFLAQFLHETGGGRVLEENLNYTTADRLAAIFGEGHHSAAIRADEVTALLSNPQGLAERVYGLGNPGKARELGNLRAGDGYRFRGRGPLQTTGGSNYQRAATRAGVDFYANPDLIVTPENVLSPALNEWTDNGLNAAADRNDIRAITKAINGGYNGITERQTWFDKIWPLANGAATPPEAWQAATPDESTSWLQTALNRVGADPSLVVDGRYGPATTQAVKWFQGQAGLTVDGIAGDITRAALRARLPNTSEPTS
ncbi:MAG TPA: peptidoglycan-binding protein [Micropepsaceae bacterium]|jgi:putative chitinase|nr:peptidoglycan-binding protein [Micropepsaceae bacterium]